MIIFSPSFQSCPTLCDPYGLQPIRLLFPWNSPGQDTGVGSLSLLQGIFPSQGLNPGLTHCRWILYQLSHKGSPYTLKVKVKLLSPVRLFVTLWTVACQAPPPSTGFSRQGYCSPTRLLCPWDFPGKNTGVCCHFFSPGDLPDPGIELRSPTLQSDSLPSEPPGNPTIYSKTAKTKKTYC